MGQEIGHERRNLRLESRKEQEQAEAMNSDLIALFCRLWLYLQILLRNLVKIIQIRHLSRIQLLRLLLFEVILLGIFKALE